MPWEGISNTQKSVSSHIPTLQSWFKKRPHLVFSIHFSVYGNLMKHTSLHLIYYFSNSLIIHEEETKEIITVKKVWVCHPNYHKILWTSALNFSNNIINALRSYIKHSKECFIRYPTTSKLVKKFGCTSFFQPSSQCLIYYFQNLSSYQMNSDFTKG